MGYGIRRRLQVARRPSVVKRALKYAVVVGSILIAINHGGAILAGDVEWNRLARMALTTMVPYCVSTLSSVDALLNAERAGP